MFFQGVEQGRGEAEIPLHKLLGVLRAVDPREVKDEIALFARLVKFLGRGVDIVGKNLINGESGMRPIFTIADVLQRRREVLPHEPRRTGNEYVHSIQSFADISVILAVFQESF